MHKSTDELLDILKSHKDYESFLSAESQEMFFGSASEYLDMLIHKKKISKSKIIQKSNLDKNYAYQIFNGTKTNPSRNKVLMIAIGMGLSIEETQKLLKMFSLSPLYAKLHRDSVILHCIFNEKSLIETNEMLNDYELELLE